MTNTKTLETASLPGAARVFICGRDLSVLSDVELTVRRREWVGFVFQAFNLCRP